MPLIDSNCYVYKKDNATVQTVMQNKWQRERSNR